MKSYIFSKLTCSAVLSSLFLVVSPQSLGASAPDSTKKTVVEQTPSSRSSSMWDALGSRFNLHHHNERNEVKAQIQALVKHKNALYASLQKAAPYISYIFEQTQKHGVPAELALLPMIESHFNPNASSNKGAAGIWQLMPKTAAHLGVKVTGGQDGRRDLAASTTAALKYLNSLHQTLSKDWLLAVAAYNYGPTRLRSAAQQGTNFWNLKQLPKETQNYLPKFLALVAVIKDPAKYNVQLPPALTGSHQISGVIGTKLSLNDVAISSDISEGTGGQTSSEADGNGLNILLLPAEPDEDINKNALTPTSVFV